MSDFDLELEQYLLGELDDARVQKLKQQLATDPALRQRFEKLQKENKDIIYDKKAMGVLQNLRQQPAAKAKTGLLTLRPALAVATLLVAVVAGRLLFFQPEPFERTKGDSSGLVFFKKSASGAQQLGQTEKVSSGQTLQISYRAPAGHYGFIFSIDGSGKVTPIYPETQTAHQLQGGSLKSLDFGYQLDQAPEFERFFLVTAETKFSINTILAQAASLAKDPERARKAQLDLPGQFTQSSKLLLKR